MQEATYKGQKEDMESETVNYGQLCDNRRSCFACASCTCQCMYAMAIIQCLPAGAEMQQLMSQHSYAQRQ